MRQRYEENATITISGRGGKELSASALLQRDPQFLNWNRILVLGSQDVMVQATTLQGQGPVRWKIHNRSDWPGQGEVEYRRSGEAFIRSAGMTQGVTIADDSIQPVAELAVHEVIESFRGGSDGKHSAEYWFLQRPRHWPVYDRPFSESEQRRLTGRWIKISSANLRFRLIATTYLRDDDRLSHEVERLIIPGVEITPIRQHAGADFRSEAEALWFTLRVLLTFGLRQYVSPLLERITLGEAHTNTWHIVEVEPRAERGDGFETSRRPYILEILPRATSRLFKLHDHQELMHAAAYGYASSFDTFTAETGLTNCVQAIERLVTTYEAVKGLDPELLDRKDWKPISKALKDHVDGLKLKPAIHAGVKRGLSQPIKLSLQDRIERMASRYRKYHDQSTRSVFAGVDKMIKARNDIVHGRLISDGSILYAERLRAQAIFERLFLWFLGCNKASTSIGYACSEISYQCQGRRLTS